MTRLAVAVIVALLAIVLVTLYGRVESSGPTAVPVTPDAPAPSPDATVTAPERTATEAQSLPLLAGVPTTTVPPAVVRDQGLPTVTAQAVPTTSKTLSSTAYCESGRMADGQYAHDGAVSSKVLPRGTSWRVLDGQYAGRVFVVEDTGSLAYFDISMPGDCVAATAYGRRPILVEQVQ